MLEKALESLLVRFLAPYVDGISRDRLRVGVLRGSLELQDLRLKPDALALLGYTTLRVKDGYVGTLRLHVPWKQLYSGKLRVSLEVFHFEVERIGDGASPLSDDELIRQMRAAKRKAVSVRASQLVDLVRQRDEERGAAEEPVDGGGAASGPGGSSSPRGPKKQGFVAKLVRKIVNNIHVDLEDARASFSNASSGLACGLELGGLDVASTDSSFEVPEQRRGSEEFVVPDGALYKLLRLRELSFRMAPAGIAKLEGAGYVLHPVSASLRLAHEPRKGLLRTEFEVAREDILEFTLVRSQVKHLRGSQAARGKEYMRLYRLMVPESEEQSLYQDANSNLMEYGALYERHLLTSAAAAATATVAAATVGSAGAAPVASASGGGGAVGSTNTSGAAPENGNFGLEISPEAATGVDPLNKRELRRLQVFEDALSVGRLARRRVLVRQRVEANEAERRRRSGEDAGGNGTPTGLVMSGIGVILGWTTRRRAAKTGSGSAASAGGESSNGNSPQATPQHRDGFTPAGRSPSSTGGSLGFTRADKERLQRDLDDESKFEEVDMPSRFCFEFILGKFALDMIDDRWSREDQRQVLSLALEEAKFVVSLDSATDHHGRDASQWCLDITLGSFHAFQAAKVALRFCPVSAPRLGSPVRRAITRRLPCFVQTEAAQLQIGNEMGSDENVLRLHFNFAPTEIHMPQGLVEEIREFIRPDLPPDPPPVASPAAPPPAAGAGGSSLSGGPGGRRDNRVVSFRTIDDSDSSPESGSRPSLKRSATTPSGGLATAPDNPLRRLTRTLTRTVSELDSAEQSSKVAEIMYDTMPVTVGSRDRAETLARKVYERIPDKLELDVKIASPIFHVPVPCQGTTIFSLGLFHLRTPVPCEYNNLDIHCTLKEMVLFAETKRGERFDMFRPALFDVQIQYSSTESESMVCVGVQAEKAGVTLVPQSLQMLMATPFAMASVMWEKEQKEKMVAAASTPVDAAENLDISPDSEEGMGPTMTIEEEGGGETNVEDEQQQVQQEEPEEAPAPVRQFTFSMTMQFDALDLTLADSVVPVMIWHMRWRPPGLIVERHRLPHPKLNVDLAFWLEVDILNTRNNAWEPLIERFDGGMLVERESPNGEVHTKVTISGRDKLLLNLKPTMLRRVIWYIPVILRGLTFEQELVMTSSDARTADVSKYRVVNLCSQCLELEFKSCHRAGLCTSVEPTGSKWERLDKWVASPYFATALVVRLPGGEDSLPLSLEHDGAVLVPNSGFVAELLTPSPTDRTQHRMLLLATSLRVHNQTDVPLQLRFHTADNEVLAVPLPPSMSCDGVLLGHFPKDYLVSSGIPTSGPARRSSSGTTDDGEDGGGSGSDDGAPLLLAPNSVGAVPLPALIREQGADVGISHTWLSVRPAGVSNRGAVEASVGGFVFCEAAEVGAQAEPRIICCKRRGENGADQPSIRLFCEARVHKATAPSPITLTTIALQAPLAFVNALPFGDLVIGFGPKSGEKDPSNCWQEARVPNLKQMNLYNFPGMLLQDGISIRARLSGGGPWSPLVHIGQGAFRERGATRPLQLRQEQEGAPGGVIVEHTDGLELRFSCPFWFVDRSGLPESTAVRLLHGGKLLPRLHGITLLPIKCQEEDCELAVTGQASLADCTHIIMDQSRGLCSSSAMRIDRTSGIATYKVRMPPNFSIQSIETRSGPGVFCIQTEDLNRSDMLGAECQVMTLRPRLILTNSSEHQIEVWHSDSDGDVGPKAPMPATGSVDLIKLEPSESRALHWPTKPGDEDSPSTKVCFRPVCSPPCQWSGTVVCSDADAGSRPFLMLAKPGDRVDNAPGSQSLGIHIPQVWSVEVAPMRGALAVSFRVGSSFAAVNRSARVKMTIRPLDKGKALADIPVPPTGQEVPYGWSDPFLGSRLFAIDAVIGGKKWSIEDVRQTRRRMVSALSVVVTISRVGTKTLLSLEDHHEQSAGAGGVPKPPDGGKRVMQVEVKLSRLGISIIEELPVPRELLFCNLGLIRLEWMKDSENDTKRIKFLISEIQVDCQLPGRVDVHSNLSRALGLHHQDRPVVILANRGRGDRMFLELFIEQGATSSADIMVPRAEVALDALDITIDDGWVVPMANFASQCRSSEGSHTMRLRDVDRLAGQSAIEGYKPPALPSVVQVESLRIAQLKFTLWCSLKLQSAGFLPPYLRDALRVLSFSDELTLEDATLKLPERRVPRHRGSLRDFLRGLASEYTMNLLNNAGVALGKSSLLNLPRVPLRIGGTTVSFLSDTMGLVAGEAASLMNHLTFDEEYVARQRQIRHQKQITDFAGGMHEAGRSLGQGIEGVLDVVKKPAEGWKVGGFQGAVVGVGQGVASGLVKPISNIGQAISDVGAGISATVGPDTVNEQRRRARPRLRLPRLLFTVGGVIRRWSELESELLWQLGSKRMQDVQEVICLAQEGQRHLVLLLYTYHLLLVEAEVRGKSGGSSSSSMGAPTAEGAEAGRGGASGSGGAGASTAGAASASGGAGGGGGGEGGSDAAGGGEGGGDGHEKAIENIAASTEKIFWQALKPVTQLVKGLQELNQGTSPKGGGQGFKGEILHFADLHDAVETDDGVGPLLNLHNSMEGRPISLPLYCGPLGTLSEPVRRGMLNGFQSALAHSDSAANWGELRFAFREERRRLQARSAASTTGVEDGGGGGAGRAADVERRDAGQLTLEVYEVERWSIMASEWQTPYLPTEEQLKWRWIDATGRKHPHIISKLRRSECSSRRRPPCALDDIFSPVGDWAVEQGPSTDGEGWSYGLSWRSTTWDTKPGLFDVFRKRKWQRTYK